MDKKEINFIALDLETATCYKESICEIGLAFVQHGEIVNTKSWLVRPPENLYDSINMSIHGITPEMTEKCPTFDEIWPTVVNFLNNKLIVAHNTSFDMYAIKEAIEYYNLPMPMFQYICSLRTAKKAIQGLYSYSLPNICEHLSIDLDGHHRAEADAKACAEVMLKCMSALDISDFKEISSVLRFKIGNFDGEVHTPQRAIKNYSKKKQINTSEIIPDSSKFDESNYFFDKEVCFTGKFVFATRMELLQAIADIGAIPVNSVRKTTNILVVGQQDYKVVGDSGMSSKQKKAIELVDNGQDLEIMSEKEFYEIFGIPQSKTISNLMA